MNFNSKETYIQAVAEWKQQYKELSQQIRDTRAAFVLSQQTYEKTSRKEYANWISAWKEMERLRGERYSLSSKATNMLNERASGKEQAQAQFLLSVGTKSTCDYITA